MARARGLFGAAYVLWRNEAYAAADDLFEAGRRAWSDEANDESDEMSAYSAWSLPLVTRWERHDDAAQRTLDDLKKQSEGLRKSAQGLKTKTADKLDTARVEINEKLEKLKRAYESAKREIKK